MVFGCGGGDEGGEEEKEGFDDMDGGEDAAVDVDAMVIDVVVGLSLSPVWGCRRRIS